MKLIFTFKAAKILSLCVSVTLLQHVKWGDMLSGQNGTLEGSQRLKNGLLESLLKRHL